MMANEYNHNQNTGKDEGISDDSIKIHTPRIIQLLKDAVAANPKFHRFYDETSSFKLPGYILQEINQIGDASFQLLSKSLRYTDALGLASAVILGKLDQRSQTILVKALEDENVFVKENAIHGLVALGKEASPFLRPLLYNANPVIRESTIRALNELDDITFEDILKLIKDENEDIRDNAITSLQNYGEKAIGTLQLLIIDADPKIRIKALKTLGQIKETPLLVLKKIFEESFGNWPEMERYVFEVRCIILKRLCGLGEEVFPYFIEKSNSINFDHFIFDFCGKPYSDYKYVLIQYLDMLEQIGQPAFTHIWKLYVAIELNISINNFYRERNRLETMIIKNSDIILPMLIQQLSDDSDTAQIAVATIKKIGKPAFGPIKTLLVKGDLYERVNAVEILSTIGDPARNELVRAIEDPQGKVIDKLFVSIRKNTTITPELFWQAVFNQIILRKDIDNNSNLFNPHYTVAFIQILISYSPRLHIEILKSLCDAAYQYEDDIKARIITTGRELSASEFSALVKEKSKENPSKARDIMELLGGGEAAAYLSGLQGQALDRFRKPLAELESISLKRWNDLTTQAKWGFWLSLGMSVIWFFVGLVIIWYGFKLLASSQNVYQQIGGGALAGITTLITTFSGRFWKDPVVHIQKFSTHQARLQASFIGYMNRVAQVRLVFESKYEQEGGIDQTALQQYQDMLEAANIRASYDLYGQEKTST